MSSVRGAIWKRVLLFTKKGNILTIFPLVLTAYIRNASVIDLAYSLLKSPHGALQVILRLRVLPGLTVAWSSCYVGVGYFSLNVSERRQWIKFHAPAIRLYYVPLSFLFDSLTSAVLEAPLETQDNIRPVREERRKAQRFEPVPSVRSGSVQIFGCISVQGVIQLHSSAVLTLVQTCRPQAQRGLQPSRQRSGERARVATHTTPGDFYLAC